MMKVLSVYCKVTDINTQHIPSFARCYRWNSVLPTLFFPLQSDIEVTHMFTCSGDHLIKYLPVHHKRKAAQKPLHFSKLPWSETARSSFRQNFAQEAQLAWGCRSGTSELREKTETSSFLREKRGHGLVRRTRQGGTTLKYCEWRKVPYQVFLDQNQTWRSHQQWRLD